MPRARDFFYARSRRLHAAQQRKKVAAGEETVNGNVQGRRPIPFCVAGAAEPDDKGHDDSMSKNLEAHADEHRPALPPSEERGEKIDSRNER